MTAPSLDPVLAEMRLRAKRADWAGVRALGNHPVARDTLEGGLLVGEAEMRQGFTLQAKQRLTELVPEATRRRDAAARRRGANMLGAALFELGELEAAEASFEMALADATRDEDHKTAARATNNLGLIANLRGRHDAALALYRTAIPAYQRLGLTEELARVFHNIAITLRDLDRLVEAEENERRAMEYAVEANSPAVHAVVRTGRADISNRLGEHAVALAEASRAGQELAEIGDQVSEADALRVLAIAELGLANLPAAATAIDRAVGLAVQNGATLGHAEAVRSRAEIRLATGDNAGAADDVELASRLFDGLGATRESAEVAAWWSRNKP